MEDNQVEERTEREFSNAGTAVSNSQVVFTSGDAVDDRPQGEMEESINRTHNITIHALDFGYNVKIGCQNFAVETVDKLIKNLEAYLNNPRDTERKWMKDKTLL